MSAHVRMVVALGLMAATATGGARNAAFAAATLVTAAVAASRRYLGAYWLTDVLASVAIALASVLVVPMVVDPVIAWLGLYQPMWLQPMADAEGTEVAEQAAAR
ncbi:hypothetical protein QNM97_00410 [Gordonia sp. L191]|uniref:hypothetical protein n=1 Tax=Gordonia sp. L191 TaxID=2982699 RepID=UPI0024C0507B|nr:hypothetical protein [Gordonia sp. L191]WHU47512.1 hypothetical protein QNM97_00410 [Gordonia sp. L191]